MEFFLAPEASRDRGMSVATLAAVMAGMKGVGLMHFFWEGKAMAALALGREPRLRLGLGLGFGRNEGEITGPKARERVAKVR